jgi:hypothetical protein
MHSTQVVCAAGNYCPTGSSTNTPCPSGAISVFGCRLAVIVPNLMLACRVCCMSFQTRGRHMLVSSIGTFVGLPRVRSGTYVVHQQAECSVFTAVGGTIWCLQNHHCLRVGRRGKLLSSFRVWMGWCRWWRCGSLSRGLGCGPQSSNFNFSWFQQLWLVWWSVTS